VISADPRYIAARRALLEALFALQDQAGALVIAGAQAVYLHTGRGDLAITPFTTDADLAVDPERLCADPLIEAAMKDAGFTPRALRRPHRTRLAESAGARRRAAVVVRTLGVFAVAAVVGEDREGLGVFSHDVPAYAAEAFAYAV
jgi:hypothetical protein